MTSHSIERKGGGNSFQINVPNCVYLTLKAERCVLFKGLIC